MGTTRAEGGAHPLSAIQEGIWMTHEMAPRSPAYNVLCALRARGAVDPERLRLAVRRLGRRHPILRTVYRREAGRPVQRLEAEAAPELAVVEAGGWDRERLDAWLSAEGDRPFDLARGPVLRVALLRGAGPGPLLVLTFHHIAYDLWSLDLLLHELQAAYAAPPGADPGLAPPPADYFDYVRWQRRLLAGPEGERLLAWWRRELGDLPPPLDLPTDRPRPATPSLRGAACPFPLGPGIYPAVRELAAREGTTPFVVLLTAFQLLLAAEADRRRFVVGTPTAGRTRRELEELVGCFINPLPVVTELEGDPTFAGAVGRARRRVLAMMEHQEYPFSRLVEHLAPGRRAGRSPLFQVMFVWDRFRLSAPPGGAPFAPRGLELDGARLAGEALPLEPWAMEQRGAAYDLTLVVFEGGDETSAALVYSHDLWRRESVERLAAAYRRLLAAALARPESRLSALFGE